MYLDSTRTMNINKEEEYLMKKNILTLFAFLMSCVINAQAHGPGYNQNNGSVFTNPTSPKTVVHHHYIYPPTYGNTNHYYYSPPSPRRHALSTPYRHRRSSNATFSNALGAAVGGLAGSKLGKGSGKLASTAAGTMLGYYLGGRLGAE